MKKRLLFVIPSVDAGGAQKSLVNLLHTIDYTAYEVDLLLLRKFGIFFDSLPSQVKVIDAGQNYSHFTSSLLKAIFEFTVRGKFYFAYCRFMFFLEGRGQRPLGENEQKQWHYLKQVIGNVNAKYDAAIGFLEKTSNYLVVDCVNANKKIGFIHNDYDKLLSNKDFDLPYFNKLDAVVTISEQCLVVLQLNFPQLSGKFKIMYNIISADLITQMAQEEVGHLKDDNYILSIGRLDKQKGFDMAIHAVKILVNKGIEVKWFIIGEGPERVELETLIANNNLSDKVILLGLKSNPYPYIYNTLIYFQPSRYEGKSIAIDEAKILCKPIVVTNFSTVGDQIAHLNTGYITKMNSESIAEGLEYVLQHPEVRSELTKNLSELRLDTKDEIEKLYMLINE